MKNWKNILIAPSQPIREALIKIDSAGAQIALVADENCKLLGTVSDGDIRRGLLKGMTLSDAVEGCMYRNPHTARSGDCQDSILAKMRREKLHQLPVLDEENHIVGMEILNDYLSPVERDNWVVLMAGGLGTRLGELTKATPKPMLHVGDKPLLEIILRHFLDQGFRNFYLSVNYMAEVIEAHFGNGEHLGAQICYIKEAKRMGTAGSLSLLPELPVNPLIVANGDLLANIDYANMLDVHVDSGAAATMAVSEYEIQIPYGVVCEKNGLIQRIDEKPVHTSLISAGVYVLSPAVLSHVPEDTLFDMPALFEALIANKMNAATYKVRGYWLDIGRTPDYQKANADIDKVFLQKLNSN